MALMLLYMQPVFCGRARRYERSFADGAESRRGIMNNVLPTAQGYLFAQGCSIDHKKNIDKRQGYREWQ
ncbi:hypothetical protein BJJ97_04480 [Pectobacterium polaris]|nr:hypothetical protein BJJ97_04480 [Pectobacterium polaris]